MRILWIGKRPTDGEGGDEVFDLRTIAACRNLGCDIDVFHPMPVGRLWKLAKMIIGLLPYPRSTFASAANRTAIAERSQAYDAVVCSGEWFEPLVHRLSPPSILIVHNVVSRSLPAVFPHNWMASLGAFRAGVWERRWYRVRHFAAIGALSRRDLAYLHGLKDRPKVLLLSPGMPPSVGLAPDAVLRSEIVVSGTFDWLPKRRDIRLFAREYAALEPRLPIRSTTLPPEVAGILHPLAAPSSEENRTAIRFGLITDRFEAGYKLKTTALIANNQIVLSFAEVGSDFRHIPDSDFFIRKIESVADIVVHVDAIAALPVAAIRERLIRFKQACARDFTWNAVATTLLCSMAPPRQLAAL
jgi:hypothetical protein